jgi:hypothetical protein
LAGRREFNKGQPELRVLVSRPAASESVGFPLVQQVALLRRHLRHHQPETVALITSLPPQRLNAAQWLAANRNAWGIENGLHQRLDVSRLDDLCRIRTPNSMWIMGMLRRFSNSLFMHWRAKQPKPRHKTTTDFLTAMDAEHHRYALRALKAVNPTFQTLS